MSFCGIIKRMKVLIINVKKFFDGIDRCNLSAHAAASAYYMFVSLVPFLALLSAVIPYTGTSEESLMTHISPYIPDALRQLIGDIVSDIYLASGAILPISILLSVYLASRAFASLIRGIEVVSGSGHYASFLRRTVLACLYTVGVIAAMVLVILVTFFGERLLDLIYEPISLVLIKLRFVLVALLLTVLFTLVYHWIPGLKIRFYALIPGAVFAACAWLLFTWLFSLFIMSGNSYSIYGSLAAIVISLLWMYWCMYIILLGAYLNVFISSEKQNKDT